MEIGFLPFARSYRSRRSRVAELSREFVHSFLFRRKEYQQKQAWPDVVLDLVPFRSSFSEKNFSSTMEVFMQLPLRLQKNGLIASAEPKCPVLHVLDFASPKNGNQPLCWQSKFQFPNGED